MATMIDSLRDLASPAVVSALSQHTAESESAISRGLGAAIPAIASTIANRADDQGFMKDLADLATRTAAGPDSLQLARSFASSPMGVDTTNPIEGWLSSLFGGNLSDVTGNVARVRGYQWIVGRIPLLDRRAAGPGISRAFDTERLRSRRAAWPTLLREQRAQLASSLPTASRCRESTEPYEMAPTPVEKRASTGWSVPAVALLTALCVGGLLWWARDKPVEVAQVTHRRRADRASRHDRDAPGNIAREPSRERDASPIPSVGSAEYRLSMYLASAVPGATTINFDSIAFDSDSAALTAESSEQLQDIATILRAYPQASVTVAGHTDSAATKQRTMALSRARADAVDHHV